MTDAKKYAARLRGRGGSKRGRADYGSFLPGDEAEKIADALEAGEAMADWIRMLTENSHGPDEELIEEAWMDERRQPECAAARKFYEALDALTNDGETTSACTEYEPHDEDPTVCYCGKGPSEHPDSTTVAGYCRKCGTMLLPPFERCERCGMSTATTETKDE